MSIAKGNVYTHMAVSVFGRRRARMIAYIAKRLLTAFFALFFLGVRGISQGDNNYRSDQEIRNAGWREIHQDRG